MRLVAGPRLRADGRHGQRRRERRIDVHAGQALATPEARANSHTSNTTNVVRRLVRVSKNGFMWGRQGGWLNVRSRGAGVLIFVNRRLGQSTHRVTKLDAMTEMKTLDAGHEQLTIGRLAKAANVGVETVRYYQGRGLLPVPKPVGAVRRYPAKLIDRIGFIKRAQSLGFSLEEVATLLSLEDGRNRRAVRALAEVRLSQIRSKLSDLERMRAALHELVRRCQVTGQAHPCPIIEALVGAAPDGRATAHEPARSGGSKSRSRLQSGL
jgi:MerR family mercuric resistance operon transcriptional regulator